MWVKRNPVELEKSLAFARQDARSHGLLIGGAAWALLSIVLAGRWLVNFNLGIVAQRDGSIEFWKRLPLSMILTFPLCAFVFWLERKRMLAKNLNRKVCLKCEVVKEGAVNGSCSCGEEMVPAYTAKWVE